MVDNPKMYVQFYDKAFPESVELREPDYYHNWIIKLLDPSEGAKLLDVACGAGFLLKAAKEMGLTVTGVDFSRKALYMAKQLAPGCEVISADGETLPFRSQMFEYVTCLGSLEHFQHPSKGVRELVRVIKKRGRAIITVPNTYFIKDIYMVWREGFLKGSAQISDRFGTKMGWFTLLGDNGSRVLETLKYDPKWEIRSLGHLTYRIFRPFIPLNLSYRFVFICTT